ncbi:hypothetical protein PC128_g19810 [Phytophthora cactorum]|nr:hypothetical protein PC128_g19810 [Phytophthora cactorum]
MSKLLMKFGDLALETFLLHQMLESGSPAVLIAIFTVVVASNALICAVMMFVPYKRAPRAETFVDILFDFLIAIASTPRTYTEWENPTNVTEKLTHLAATGDLQTIQVTNRYLGELPEELRRCNGLKHLSLEYTHTQALPTWIKEFTKLEYLHVESKFTSPMTVLPDDMFDDMSSLTLDRHNVMSPRTGV